MSLQIVIRNTAKLQKLSSQILVQVDPILVQVDPILAQVDPILAQVDLILVEIDLILIAQIKMTPFEIDTR
jgi:hypothetical protein